MLGRRKLSPNTIIVNLGPTLNVKLAHLHEAYSLNDRLVGKTDRFELSLLTQQRQLRRQR